MPKYSKSSSSKLIYKFVIFASLIIIIPLGLYFFHFHGRLSDNSAEWANFAIYLTAFISLSNLIVFAIFSFLVYQYNKGKDDLLLSLERPILQFSLIHKGQGDNRETLYQATNVGRGPALNIIYHFFYDKKAPNAYLGYSMSPSNKPYILGPRFVKAILATYNDVSGNKYFSLIENDRNEFAFGDAIPERIQYYLSICNKSPTWPNWDTTDI